MSSIPFKGPAGAVRVGWSDGQPVLHPSRRDLATSELDLLYAGTRDKAVRRTALVVTSVYLLQGPHAQYVGRDDEWAGHGGGGCQSAF